MGTGQAEESADGRCKGERTRTIIIDAAVRMAGEVGFDGLTIGSLAKNLKLSKSGLFSHFRSKENLQLQVLHAAGQRFVAAVVTPALAQPTGEPQVRALVARWWSWVDAAESGGCVFVQAAAELDDRPGPLREALVKLQRDWSETLRAAAQSAMDVGHFHAEVDPGQLAFEMHSVMLGYHHAARLMGDPEAKTRVAKACNRLIEMSQAS